MKTAVVKRIAKPLWAGFFVLIAIFVLAASAAAKERPPLPPALKNGRKVAMVPMLGDPDVFNRIRGKMKRWRRWEITDADHADLILVFTWHRQTLSAVSAQIREFNATGQIKKLDVPGWEKTYERPEYLAFFDRATGDLLLTVSSDRRGSASYTADILFGRLKAAIETAEKQEKKRK